MAAPAGVPLFTVPFGDTPPPSKKIVGTITCTSPADRVYLLTFNSPPDNRFTSSFCHAVMLALDIVEHSYPPGVLVTTSGLAKFYSNGLDLEHAMTAEGFWDKYLYRMFEALLRFPMPTVALINGHAFAGGLILAMYQDYRIFNPSRGFLCLNELDFGFPLGPSNTSIFRGKIGDRAVFRALVLESKRFNAQEALAGGLVDGLGSMDDVLELIKEKNLLEKGKSGAYGIMRTEMYIETMNLLTSLDNVKDRNDTNQKEKQRKESVKNRVEEWTKSTKAKL